MFNPETNEITFPHIITGNVLAGKVHSINCINGGFKYLADLNLIRNKFYGGNVEKFGFIAEYGFYAMIHYEIISRVLGFYIHDGSTVTELGKQVLQDKYPGATINYSHIDNTPKELTKEQIDKKRELIAKAVDKGMNAAIVSKSTADELASLIDCFDSGVNKKAQVSVENVTPVVENVPIAVTHLGKK